jgi:hypothetical protein
MAMIDDFNESFVTVSKTELLEILRKNRDAHRDIFLKAQIGYRKLAIEELDKMLADAREGKRIIRQITLVEPQDHTRDYTRVIQMLEMSQADSIKVTESQFRCYVQDEWNWKDQFIGSTAGYMGR